MKKTWKRFDERPANQKFICPHCESVCYCKPVGGRGHGVTACDYSYCPYCGKEVAPIKAEVE